MKRVKSATAGEYALWYLGREGRKRPGTPVPTDPRTAVTLMQYCHTGKWCSWYPTAQWSIVSLEDPGEFSKLVFLDSDWTRAELLTVDDADDYRLLGRVAKRAIDIGYLSRSSADKHRTYYEQLQRGELRLGGDDRLVIRSLNDGERVRNPSGTNYLQDGAGRGLPYMILLAQRRLKYEPVEAFLAEKT